eukprot:gene1496-2883_t
MNFLDSVSSLLGSTTVSSQGGSTGSKDSALYLRRNLLISLKDCIFKLTPLLHQSEAGGILDEKVPAANALCSAVEHCLLQGIKIREFHGIVPFWGLLERLESLDPPSIVIRNSVGAVACIPTLHTPLARARGWIRQILNVRGLEDALQAIQSHRKLVSTFYTFDAIMNHPEDFTALIAVVRSLKVYNFNFIVDSDALNIVPHWFFDLMSDQSSGGSGTRTSSGSNNESLMKSDYSTRSQRSNSVPGESRGRTRQQQKQCDDDDDDGSGSGSGDVSSSRKSRSDSFSSVGTGTSTASNNSSGSSSNINNVSVKKTTTNNNNSTGSVTTDSFAIDTFLSLFEQSFDVVIDQVDAAATLAAKFITEKLEANEQPSSRSFVDHTGPSLKWRTPFFGSPLKALVLDESRCPYARLEPRLGIPTQAISLLDFVERHITTPGLLRHSGTAQEMEGLKELLERCEDVSDDSNPHVAVQCLMEWLYDLEEPLLGYEHYDAIQSCMGLDNETDRVRNLSLLVQEAPWWHLALLLRVVALMQAACLPHNAKLNGLNLVAVAVAVTPILIRPRPAGSALYARSRSLGQCVERDPDERDRQNLAAAEVQLWSYLFLGKKKYSHHYANLCNKLTNHSYPNVPECVSYKILW